MIPLTPLLATVLFLLPGTTAQEGCEPACPLSAAEARTDLEYLLAQVERHHPQPFRLVSRTEWEESIRRIAAAPERREPAAFQAAVLGLLARMGDGELERLTHATFVGEPTAAPPNHHADATSFELPHSGIEVETSTLYWQKSDPRDQRRWMHPDIPAPITFIDWKADVDPALEAIKSHLRSLPDSLPERPTPRNWTRGSQRPALP